MPRPVAGPAKTSKFQTAKCQPPKAHKNNLQNQLLLGLFVCVYKKFVLNGGYGLMGFLNGHGAFEVERNRDNVSLTNNPIFPADTVAAPQLRFWIENEYGFGLSTELLASHCIELAESAGADHDRVVSVVRSAVNNQSPGELMTLTAAAATALRGEAALKARLPKEARKNAAISPYDRGIAETHWGSANIGEVAEQAPCVGEVLQHTRKGVVYGVCDETTAWPYRRERGSSEEVYFGLKTAQGLLEFKCKSKIHKQRWVDGIQNLLRQVSCVEATERSMEFLSLSNRV
ncbi:hypothetical protein GH714_030385 [Hevea brasiliensis]|uniref:PH domain-containing protein n=1 Tax=Hevea brasiliensis TaxID=3981 RepID=A0A6A6LC98_HEVBR|nr:hypothetical protein GH714_030385 [Hevea brasiliensis]